MNPFAALRNLLFGQLFLVEVHEIEAESGCQGCQRTVGARIACSHKSDNENDSRKLTQGEGHRGEDLVVDHHSGLVHRQLESRLLGIINQGSSHANSGHHVNSCR